MKNSTRVAAVAATVLLAATGAPAAGNAQGIGSILDAVGGLLPSLPGSSDLAIPGSSEIPGSAGLNPLAGSSDIEGSAELSPLGGSSDIPGSGEFNPLAGSSDIEGSSELLGGSGDIGSTEMAPLSTNLLGGSSNLPTDLTGSLGTMPLSSDLLGGSSEIPMSAELPPLSTNLLGGSAEFGSADLAPLVGSEDMSPLSTNLLGGSAEFGSADLAPLVGSEDMSPLSSNLDLLGGSAEFGSADLAPLVGSQEMAPLSADLLGGSAELAPVGSLGMAPIVSSLGMEPLSTELNVLGGSAELPALSANFPDGSTEGIGGSAEEVGEGISGSLQSDSLGTLVGSVESNSAAEIITARAGSIEGVAGSLTGETGSTAGSSEVLTGSFGDLTQVNGSLTALTGSLEAGSDNATASSGTGSAVGQLSSLETVASVDASVGGGLLPILSLGGAAALGAGAIGAAVGAGGGVQLPPLPGVPNVCDLPQAQVDQLAGLGSVDAQNCLDPQN